MKNKLGMLISLLFTLNSAQALNAKDTTSVKAIDNFHINKYLGTWYEVARLPNYFEKKCNFPITATYDKSDDGKVSVTNSCQRDNGSTNTSIGKAIFAEEQNIGKLKVTFAPSFLSWMKFAYGDYWVLATDYKHYSLVGDPSRQYLWILSRTPKLAPEYILQLKATAKSMGYDLSDLISEQ
jgi:apolipoprotein D and lipocalin family protein